MTSRSEMAKSSTPRLLSILLLVSFCLTDQSMAMHIPSNGSPGERLEDAPQGRDDDMMLASGAPFGGIHARSLPPPIFDPASGGMRQIQQQQSSYPFVSHLSSIRNLINTSAADLGLADDVKNKILKYYFASGPDGPDGQQQPQATYPMGQMIHSPKGHDATDMQPTSPVPKFPMRESEIRRLLTRFTGHPFEVLLRRALRASRNDQARNRRYKAIQDTSFIRFGRSGGQAMDLDPDRPAADFQIPDLVSSDDLVNRNDDNNNLIMSPFVHAPASGYPFDSADSYQGENMVPAMVKKGRPDRYYLRFG